MSRSFKGGMSRPQSQAAGIAAAQQMALGSSGGFGVGGTGLSGTSSSSSFGSTAATRKAQAAAASTLVRPLSRTQPRRPAPRGSAAPSDGSSSAIDLSSFGPGSSANFSTGDASTENLAPAALENEYIVNLQQQVYFLELELNLMKKAGGGGGSTNPTGLRGSGAPSDNGSSGGGGALTDANVPDAPLDDVMLSLREKYVKMESEFKKEFADLKNENSELRSRSRMRELEIANLKNLHATLTAESVNWKNTAQDHQSTLLDHQLANEQMILKLTARLAKRERKLEKVMEELVHLRAEHRVTVENYTAEREGYTAKWNEREAAMDALNASYLAEKEANLEWAEKFRQSNEAALMSQLQELQHTTLAQESAVKKAELSREQAEKNRQAALESLDKIMHENEGLRAALQGMENEVSAQRTKEDRDRASKSFWSSEVSHMQQQIGSLTDKLNKVSAKYADSKGLKKQLKDELIKSRVYLDELQARLLEEQDAHNKTRGAEEESSELNREMKRDLQIKTEELQTLMARFKEVRAESESAAKDRDHYHVQLTELQSKFDVAEALQGLKLHEFVSMAHSNLKVAGAIENLMGKMKAGEKEVKGAHKRERQAQRDRDDDDLYSERSQASTSSSLTPRGAGRPATSSSSITNDSRPATQDSELTDQSRPQTGTSSMLESSFDGV